MEKLTKIWKQFIITLSSVMLLNLSFVYNVEGLKFSFSNSAYAEEVVNYKGDTGTVKIDEAGGNFVTDSGTALLVFIASAIVVYKLITSCTGSTPWDLYGAALGAGIFIAGELMSIMGSKEELSAKTLEYKIRGEDGQIDDEQYAALQKEKEMMDSISSAADKRAKMQTAAAVVFAGSAALALYEETQIKAAELSCSVAVASSVTCAPVLSIVKTKEGIKEIPAASITKWTGLAQAKIAEGAELKTCVVTAKAELEAAEAAAAASAGGGTAAVILAGKELAAAIGAENSCTISMGVEKMNEVACKLSTSPLFGATEQANPKEEIKSFYAGLLDMIVPTAEAAGMGDMLKGIAGAIAGYYVGQSTMINTLITTPNHRAILWGSLAAYGYIVAGNTKDEAETAKSNSDKIAKIMKRMDRSRGSVQMDNKMATAGASNLGRQINIGTQSQALGTTMPCSNGSSKDSQGKTICNPAPFTTKSSFSGTGAFPASIAPLMKAGGSFISANQGKNSVSGDSLGNIDTINGQKNAINGLLDKAKKNLNKTLLSAGKKPVDFNKEQNKVMKGLANAIRNSLRKSGDSSSGLLGRMGYGSQLKSDKKPEAVEEVAKEITASVDTSSGKGLESKKPGFDFDFAAGQSDAIVAAKNAEFDANAQAANENAEIKDDIIQDKSVSIFKVISIRYKKSGFKRLLDEL